MFYDKAGKAVPFGLQVNGTEIKQEADQSYKTKISTDSVFEVVGNSEISVSIRIAESIFNPLTTNTTHRNTLLPMIKLNQQ